MQKNLARRYTNHRKETMIKYLITKNNEPVQLKSKVFVIACCDCGLVHRHELKVNKDGVFLVSHRENRSTGQLRRHGKFRMKFSPQKI